MKKLTLSERDCLRWAFERYPVLAIGYWDERCKSVNLRKILSWWASDAFYGENFLDYNEHLIDHLSIYAGSSFDRAKKDLEGCPHLMIFVCGERAEKEDLTVSAELVAIATNSNTPF